MPCELADREQVQAERFHLGQHAEQRRLIQAAWTDSSGDIAAPARLVIPEACRTAWSRASQKV
jgi:hypothetical protein